MIGEYWNDYTKAQAAFESGSTVLGTTWQVIYNLAVANNARARHGVPEGRRDRMVGHVDDLVQGRPPELHVQVDGLHHVARRCRRRSPYYFGEAPANPKACDLITDDPTHCDTFKAKDADFARRFTSGQRPARSASTARATTACRSPSGSRLGPRSRASERSVGRPRRAPRHLDTMDDAIDGSARRPSRRVRAGCTDAGRVQVAALAGAPALWMARALRRLAAVAVRHLAVHAERGRRPHRAHAAAPTTTARSSTSRSTATSRCARSRSRCWSP